MPTYDYKCDANERIVEVRHRMNDEVKNWGELCELAGLDPQGTPLDAPVKRLPTGGNVVKSGVGKESVPPCQVGGGGCPSGGCGA